MDEIIKETKATMRALDAEERAELLMELNATWCAGCGEKQNAKGDCCDA